MGRNGQQYIAVVAAANSQGAILPERLSGVPWNESLDVFTLPPARPAAPGTLGEARQKLEEVPRHIVRSRALSRQGFALPALVAR